ncbi:MAG TPA: YoaK family protein [Verrucomicrobiae bacterium]|nr:YoaK family protein [Verrucomicrobiae bacterium]
MASALSELRKSLLPPLRWLLLAFASGATNTGGFLGFRSFVSHVTGFYSLLGADFALKTLFEAFSVATVPFYFLLGCMFSAWLVDRRIQQGQKPLYSVPLGFAAILILVVALGGHSEWFGEFGGPVDLFTQYPALVMLCLASGLHNAVVTAASGTILRSSHLTGTTTDLGTGVVRWLITPANSIERGLERRLVWMRAANVAFFVIGAFVGALCFHHWQFLGFLMPAGVTVLVGIWVRLAH